MTAGSDVVGLSDGWPFGMRASCREKDFEYGTSSVYQTVIRQLTGNPTFEAEDRNARSMNASSARIGITQFSTRIAPWVFPYR